jgi:hypothetical protein
MSYVVAAPEMLAAMATKMASIGSALNAANAAAPTTQMLAAGADEVSAAVATLFAGNAQAYQAVSAEAAPFHDQFVLALRGAVGCRLRQQRPHRSAADPEDPGHRTRRGRDHPAPEFIPAVRPRNSVSSVPIPGHSTRSQQPSTARMARPRMELARAQRHFTRPGPYRPHSLRRHAADGIHHRLH